ncbi:MAG TPA: hypothetical protein VGX00_01385 [Thermoplasmata archaeon]|nr:hypothetical protein [Thermoplasmata archaeon]
MIAVEAALAAVAALMATTTALILKWAAEADRTIPRAIVVFLLAMMAAMFAGGLVYFLAPGPRSLVEGLWLSAGLMSGSVLPLLAVFLREAARASNSGPSSSRLAGSRSLGFLTTVIGFVIVSEFLMGWSFLLASGATPRAPGPLALTLSVIDSPWFLFTMAAEMAATAFLLRDRLSPPARFALGVQASVMALAPPAIDAGPWVTATVLAGSAAMVAFIIFALEHLYRNPTIERRFSNYLLAVLAAFASMMAGLFVWAEFGNAFLFAASILLEMTLYFAFVIDPARFGRTDPVSWSSRPRWTALVLAAIFVAELFMGAVVDRQIQPGLLAAGTLPFSALSGGWPSVLAIATSNGFWFFATVTASTGFLAMMGVEMGALVVFKMRETRNLENRIRLGLMIGCYAAFAVFYPSLYFGLVAPHAPDPSQVPVLGWSMGIGSYPISATVLVALVGTYAITGSLSALFGRRAICSTLCTAALMYQGSAIDAMKSFNRSSPIGRKYLSSRLSGVYQATSGVVLGSLALTSALSVLDTRGLSSLRILGADPTVFFFAFYFSVLWYLMFVAVPFAGTYNCVTMGWCYTGTIAQAFQRIGFFKLKVRDPQVCRDCTTLDCAKGCPIGLVDMPGHFRTKGEFRSSKCCGVGECVEACPHGNLYISDVRHWMRRRLGWEDRIGPGRTIPALSVLPTVPRPRPPAVAHAAPAGRPGAQEAG